MAQSPGQTPDIALDNAVINSPRSTLESLQRLTDEFQELVIQDGLTWDNRPRVRNIQQQLEKLFDLREVPPKYRHKVANESAVYLRESLARFPMPSLDQVPDAEEIIAWQKAGRAPLYRVPGTPVVVKATDAGIYEGRFQFSPATIDEARNWYEVASEYPYRDDQKDIAGLYETYFLTPGPMISARLIRALPDWMHYQLLDQTVWQWALLMLTVAVLGILFFLLYLLVQRLARGRTQVQRDMYFLLWPIGVIYLTLGARSFLDQQVFLSGAVLQDVLFVAKFIILAAVVLLVMRLGSLSSEAILAVRRFESRKVEQQLVRLAIRMFTVLVAVVIVIEGMQQIGFSLATLVAGAGVTGLAIALAAQDTLKNVFGGLLLAMDRPFEAGQRVRIKGYEGFVQEVGLRSTKIRTLKGHQIIIPNDEAARIEVENIGRRPYIRRDLNVTITYDTPPAKITRAMEILRDILAVPESAGGEQSAHPNQAINQPGYPPRVYFSDLNADSLNLLVVYWFHPPDHWLSLEFADGVNMQIMQRFNDEGIDFAFPSQTLYLAGDERRPLNVGNPPASAHPVHAGAGSRVGDTPGRRGPATSAARRDASIEDDMLPGETAEGDGGESSA